MYKTMARMPELKSRPVQVSLEVRMGCGRGVCYGCTIKTRQGLRQVCQDGPVFNLEDVIWEELVSV
jgi:dihydroorotate dehydrogenase electron transfer subunit